jgi:hypothetical protein
MRSACSCGSGWFSTTTSDGRRVRNITPAAKVTVSAIVT